MIKVQVGNTLKKSEKIVSADTTLRKVLEDAGVNYTTGITNLDGSSLTPGDLDKTFADFGIKERCYLVNVVKADNAV